MAEVKVTAIVNLRVTDSEWKLIMRALAAFAGVKIDTNGKHRRDAEVLNRQLLMQRRQDLREQLEVAEGALKRAEQAAEDASAPEPDPNIIDQFSREAAGPDSFGGEDFPTSGPPNTLPKGWAK